MKPLHLASLAAAVGAAAALAFAADAPASKPDRELAAVNVEYEGTKVWVPAVFIVKKGEKVRLTLINNAPSGEHGYSIHEVGVHAVVPKNAKRVVEFTASKAGLFRIFCQLHPAHVGGQLLVLE